MRVALGATAGVVIWLIIRQSMRMIVAGIAVGMSAALAAGRLMEQLIPGVRHTELLIFTIMISVLVVAAWFAGFVTARHASLTDPVPALRQE